MKCLSNWDFELLMDSNDLCFFCSKSPRNEESNHLIMSGHILALVIMSTVHPLVFGPSVGSQLSICRLAILIIF